MKATKQKPLVFDFKSELVAKDQGGTWELKRGNRVTINQPSSRFHDKIGTLRRRDTTTGEWQVNIDKEQGWESIPTRFLVKAPRRRLTNQRLIDRFICESLRCQTS